MTVLRINGTIANLFDARLAGLVHESVHDEPSVRFRHERFLVSRLAAGVVMMAALPPYLLWRGVPSDVETLAIASLFLPVLAAALLSQTGILWIAHALSSAGLTGVVVCLAAMTGGSSSAAAIWLVAIPLEAVVSGSIRATVAASLIAAIGAIAIALSGNMPPPVPAITWPSALVMPLFALTAIGHIAAQAIEHMRREGEWRRRMRDNEARDRMLLSAIDDLVTWHDCNGRVLEASASSTKIVGLDPQRLRGQGLLDRVHVGDRPALLQTISEVARSGQPGAVPFRLHLETPRPDGCRTIFAEMRAHRIEGGADGVSRSTVVAVTRDVSEHRRHAEELDRARAEAERADEVKSRFLATVTHELRTPLNAIIGFSEVLSGEGNQTLTHETRSEYAGIITASGHHLLEVVNTLLDMSRIQSGHFDFAPERIEFGVLVEGCCDLMRLRAAEAGVTLVRIPFAGECWLMADARACRQVLINLISNALKFTPRGGRVEIGMRCAGSYVDLFVSDSGTGIPESDLPRIGDPFFQSGGGYHRSHEGTGLGLSVVRGLVGLHQGSIAIESAPGEGTSVTVTLPYEVKSTEGMAQPAPIRSFRRGSVPSPVSAPIRFPVGLFDHVELPPLAEPAQQRKAG